MNSGRAWLGDSSVARGVEGGRCLVALGWQMDWSGGTVTSDTLAGRTGRLDSAGLWTRVPHMACLRVVHLIRWLRVPRVSVPGEQGTGMAFHDSALEVTLFLSPSGQGSQRACPDSSMGDVDFLSSARPAPAKGGVKKFCSPVLKLPQAVIANIY